MADFLLSNINKAEIIEFQIEPHHSDSHLDQNSVSSLQIPGSLLPRSKPRPTAKLKDIKSASECFDFNNSIDEVYPDDFSPPLWQKNSLSKIQSLPVIVEALSENEDTIMSKKYLQLSYPNENLNTIHKLEGKEMRRKSLLLAKTESRENSKFVNETENEINTVATVVDEMENGIKSLKISDGKIVDKNGFGSFLKNYISSFTNIFWIMFYLRIGFLVGQTGIGKFKNVAKGKGGWRKSGFRLLGLRTSKKNKRTKKRQHVCFYAPPLFKKKSCLRPWVCS